MGIPLFYTLTEDFKYSTDLGVLSYGKHRTLSDLNGKQVYIQRYYPAMPPSKLMTGPACGAAIFDTDRYVGHSRISVSNGLNRGPTRKCLFHGLMLAIGINLERLGADGTDDAQVFADGSTISEAGLVRYLGDASIREIRACLAKD